MNTLFGILAFIGAMAVIMLLVAIALWLMGYAEIEIEERKEDDE